VGNIDLIKRVLGNDYLELSITRVAFDEDFESGNGHVVVDTIDTHGNTQTVEGSGCGVVDALWAGLLERYSMEYQSLKSIELAGFDVQAKTDTRSNGSGTDAVGEVTLKIRNSEGRIFEFKDASRSIVASSARATLAGLEYFLNAERAFITLHHSLKDARERHRDDLVTRYTAELSEVVKSTSYAEVIENLKKDI
jgi:hypothetical protein